MNDSSSKLIRSKGSSLRLWILGKLFMSFEHYYGPNFWRFVFMQGEVEKLAKSAIDYPPMQESASFNLDAVKKKMQEASAGHGQ